MDAQQETSLLSDHIGNLILQELYTLKSDIKNEIRDLGMKIALMITPSQSNESENLNTSGNIMTPQYFCEVDDIEAVDDTQSLFSPAGGNPTVIPDAPSSPVYKESECAVKVPLLDCVELTETNLMTASTYEPKEDDVVELSAGSFPQADAMTNHSSNENQDQFSSYDDSALSKSNKQNAVLFSDEKSSTLNDEMCYISDDNSAGTPVSSLPPAFSLPSVLLVKCEDSDEMFESFCNGDSVAMGCVVTHDKDADDKNVDDQQQTHSLIESNNRTLKKRSGRSDKMSLFSATNLSKQPQKKLQSCFDKSLVPVLSKNLETDKQRLICDICRKKFSHAKILTLHRKNSHGEMKLLCQLCKKPFANRAALHTHMQLHNFDRNESSEGSSDELLECSICNKVLFTNAMFNIHVKSHFKQHSFNCKYCSKMFFDLDQLHKHMREHNPKSAFKCEMCEKSFQTTRALKLHMSRHIKLPKKTHKCSVCAATFSHLRLLKLHAKKHRKKALNEEKGHSSSAYGLRKRSKKF